MCKGAKVGRTPSSARDPLVALLQPLSTFERAGTLEPFRKAGLPVIHLASPEVHKGEAARQIARERGIQEGLVCALGSVEMHPSFEHRRTIIVRRKRPCHVLYPEVGWMYARIRMRRENLKFRARLLDCLCTG
jgi:hypothetical protein